jgi:hypothetical protein
MNIENLVRTAISKIKEKWELPEAGFIAGGSIANIVWELVSGNKSVVNDIDVFLFDGCVDEIDYYDNSLLFRYQEKDTEFFEDYTGMNYRSINKDFYVIVSSENEGIFNRIKYKSNKSDTDLILRSFDINATGVGYSIEEDKCYWTKDFENFLKSGELKVSNLMTPSHTSIRIVKKSYELNCKLEQFEIDLLKHALRHKFGDTIKHRFKERYVEMFHNHKEVLSKNFQLVRDNIAEDYVKLNFDKDVVLHYLEPIIEGIKVEGFDEDLTVDKVFIDEHLNRIGNSQDFLFYMRNIYGDEKLKYFWKNLYYLYKEREYVDCSPQKEDLELLSKLTKHAPNTISNLKGMRLSEQIQLVKKVFEKYKDDPIVAISILEKHNVEDIELSDENLLLLELSVRKKIVNDTKDKVNKIFGTKKDEKDDNLIVPDFPW